MSYVRSIQRLTLTAGRNATWVGETYFPWLPCFSKRFLIGEVDSTGTYPYYKRFPRLHLLTLAFQPDLSSPNQRMHFITDGLLAKGYDALIPRLEFWNVLNGC